MSCRDLLINRNLENLGHLLALSTGHHTVVGLQLKEMILITITLLCLKTTMSLTDEGWEAIIDLLHTITMKTESR